MVRWVHSSWLGGRISTARSVATNEFLEAPQLTKR